MGKLYLPEGAFPVRCLEPATDAAGRTGDWIKLNNVQRAYIIFFVTQANAATILLTPLQATAAAGTGSKALTNSVPIWADLDCATSDALARVAADAKNYTTDAGVAHKIVVFQIDPDTALDQANNFNWITMSTGASNAANLTSALILLTDLRYGQPTPPTFIA